MDGEIEKPDFDGLVELGHCFHTQDGEPLGAITSDARPPSMVCCHCGGVWQALVERRQPSGHGPYAPTEPVYMLPDSGSCPMRRVKYTDVP